jgi:hypothetical protein
VLQNKTENNFRYITPSLWAKMMKFCSKLDFIAYVDSNQIVFHIQHEFSAKFDKITSENVRKFVVSSKD